MIDNPRLLVVDDERVICEGCDRIFSPQGFQVEKSNDSSEGLSLATENDYSVILLDVKMPKMDGIQFLEKLRVKKPDVPVVFITAYPSVPNAASAVRLGASDYVTKPFTPEEITQSVQRLVRREPAAAADSAPAEVEAPVFQPGGTRFFDDSWYQLEGSGLVRAGTVLPRSEGATVETIQFPRVGETVYQGLPLACLTTADGSSRTVPSPISGVVAAVNPVVQRDVGALWSTPLGNGWIARISPTDLEKDSRRCKRRRVLLANADARTAETQCECLASLGCRVEIVPEWEELRSLLLQDDPGVLLIDAASLADRGPELVAKVNAAAPTVKIVVVASAASQWETAYRQHRILYYAVEPFGDNEIAEVLGAAFRRQQRTTPPADIAAFRSDCISSIVITNRNGVKVCLLTGNGTLSKDGGVGTHIRQKLVYRHYPVKTTLDKGTITQRKILAAAGKCDHLFVLLTRDTGRFAGSLLRDARGEFVSVMGDDALRTTALVVQPDSSGEGLAGLDEQTKDALAERIVEEMTSCQGPVREELHSR